MSAAAGVRGPEGGVAGVDDEVAVVLNDEAGAWVALCSASPEGDALRVVDDEVAVGLHDGVVGVLAVGGCSPQGADTDLVEHEVAVALHDELEAAVAGASSLVAQELLAWVEIAAWRGIDGLAAGSGSEGLDGGTLRGVGRQRGIVDVGSEVFQPGGD